MPRYNPSVIEPKWQNYWEKHRTFATPRLPAGEKLYVLDMFPYPSGSGLHVGHPEGYTATDIVCRYSRMRGKSVLHPMGFDAFGLPAEEHAIRTNTPPRQSTEQNIDTFRRQLKMLGFSYDWDRELATTDVEYFRWTQWIFLVLFDTWFDPQSGKGRPIADLPVPAEISAMGGSEVSKYLDRFRLAYLSDELVNWCPALGTVLANEEVIDGKSERGDHPVQRIPLRQWMLRITAYADRLERDLDGLAWADGIKRLQTDWIGRSDGVELDFPIAGNQDFESWKALRDSSGFPAKPDSNSLRVFTTRADTLFGVTYMVIAPEHPLVSSLTSASQRDAVEKYLAEASSRSDRDRLDVKKQKTGVFTGSYAINPVNGKKIPVWIADYVLASYGTGAIMAVPAHDERDFAFARVFGLDIIPVYRPDADAQSVLAGQKCYPGEGEAIHSGVYDGCRTGEFKRRIAADLQKSGIGKTAVNYKLRDWLFSRQRFWGEPFPILHELDDQGNPTGVLRAVSPEDLPVELPALEDYKPHGRPEPPLAKAPDEWLYPVIDGIRYKRETNTMPQWAGSCWYYLRFIDPRNDQAFIDRELEKAWMPVDLYIGGAEHAVLHLLYARFWHKVLFDRGFVSAKEPFQRLINQGIILGEMEFTFAESGERVPPEDVEKQGDFWILKSDPAVRVESRAYKMSKSRGNVVNPDEVVRDYGADALRLFEMFMGPLEQAKPWSMAGVNGVKGFLDRAWRMIIDSRAENTVLSPAVCDELPASADMVVLHKTIKSVTKDIESLSFNTAIARLMEFVNHFSRLDRRPRSAMEAFVLLLSPMAPHIAEEMWEALGYNKTLAYEPWPAFDEKLTVDAMVEIPVQINGKIRSKIEVPRGTSKEDLERIALEDPRIRELLVSPVVKTVCVPDRLVNFVIK
jgi:leucyl-tRNA synthetase